MVLLISAAILMFFASFSHAATLDETHQEFIAGILALCVFLTLLGSDLHLLSAEEISSM